MALETDAQTTGKTALLGLDPEGIAALCEGLDLKRFHHREIYKWIYGRRTLDPSSWTTLRKAAREEIARRSEPGLPEVSGEQASSDGTRKFLLRLADGQSIECVYIPDGERRTVCVSSQVGCAMGCTFCLTAKMGIRRNLTPGEILGQFFVLESRTDIVEVSYNVVFMGMGEPMANRANLEAALALLEDPDGMGVSQRRITVSTSGLAEALEAFAQSPVCPRLSLSLNAARDDLRSQLMPVNKRHDLKELRGVLQRLTRKDRERISLEYVLLAGVNDSVEDARDVARWARGLKVKVNLISFNAAEGLPYEPATPAVTRAFQEVLMSQGITATIRRSRGLDILAACGQLARKRWGEGAMP
jgi:23S rRNA (adenine2503-C2)-methyltransferase